MADTPDTAGTSPAGNLADLERDALALDQAGTANDPNAPGTANLPAPAPKLTNAQVIVGAVSVARDVFSAATGYETPRNVLTDSAVQPMAEMWGAVCDKRGIDLSAMHGQHMDLVFAVLATAPLLIALRTGMRAEMAERARTVENEPRKGPPEGEGEDFAPAAPIMPAGAVSDQGGPELARIGSLQ